MVMVLMLSFSGSLSTAKAVKNICKYNQQYMVRPTLIDLNMNEPCFNQRHSRNISHMSVDVNFME